MITSRTMEILENIGLNEEILSTGTVIESGQVNFNHHLLGSVTFELPETTRYPFAFVNPQPECEEAFENVLKKRGGKIERDSEVIGLQIFKDYVQVSTNSGTIKARYVVGCDGAHSLVRHSQQTWKFEGRPVSILWTQCDGTIADERVSSTNVAFAIGKPGNIHNSNTHPRICR